MELTYGPDGLAAFDVPGLEAYVLADLDAELIDGEPQLVSIAVRPRVGQDAPSKAPGLTPEVLAQVPSRALAAFILYSRQEDVGANPQPWWAAMHGLGRETAMTRPYGGSDAFSEEVANVVRAARGLGASSIRAVADRWNVSDDRANQYIREMKQRLGDRAPGDGRRERHHRRTSSTSLSLSDRKDPR